MAETRKYDPAQGDDFAAFVRNAIGGDVRPNTPGASSTDVTSTPDEEPGGGMSLSDIPHIKFPGVM